MEDKKKQRKLKHIARENMAELLSVANEYGVQPEDIVQILPKGNTIFLVYAE